MARLRAQDRGNLLWSVSLALTLLLGICAWPSLARAQTQPPSSSSVAPFDVYWGVGGTHAGGLSLRGVATKPAKTFGGTWFGLYPAAGPHMIELYPGGREQFYTNHLAKIATDLQYFVPDPQWDGLAVIDWEFFQPFWTDAYNEPSTQAYDAPDNDMLDDWRDYIRAHRAGLLAGLNTQQQEEVFKQTYLAATREFLTRTIRECKRLRPQTKWSLYGLPRTGYYPIVAPDYGPFRQMRDNLETAHMAELSWLLDELDVICPSYYIFYRSFPTWSGTDTDTFADNTRFLHDGVDYCVRFAQGRKPVVPFLWYYYHDSTTNRFQMLSEFNMRNALVQPAIAGASGVLIWGYVPGQYWQTALQNYLDTTLARQIGFYTSAVGEMRRSNTPASQWFFVPPWSNSQPSMNSLHSRLNEIVLSRPTNPNATPPSPLGVVTVEHLQGTPAPRPAAAPSPPDASPRPSHPAHRERLRGDQRRRGAGATSR